ncbi:hypothetical protein [Gemmobacter lanyuensis]|uniref:hypothetical protein n=1 Tax=Gemmobacter lanyuensis TaxID=1054497 RepID=UPI0016754DBA|nr:hypothetical protein [Gemmobacter lanyuensis]
MLGSFGFHSCGNLEGPLCKELVADAASTREDDHCLHRLHGEMFKSGKHDVDTPRVVTTGARCDWRSVRHNGKMHLDWDGVNQMTVRVLTVGELNSLHMEYSHRFKVEFQQLLEQMTFARVVFRNNELLFKDEETPFYHTLHHCFGCSFEGMALGLSRVWDKDCKVRKDQSHLNLISIPMLATHFADQNFLGCHGLKSSHQDRVLFDTLYADPLRTRLRVVRTEALAHSVMVGKSKDRYKSDINGKHDFGVVNGDALDYCQKTLDLLFSLNDQLTISKWRAKRTMADMTGEWNERHVAFLRHFVPEVQ